MVIEIDKNAIDNIYVDTIRRRFLPRMRAKINFSAKLIRVCFPQRSSRKFDKMLLFG